MRLEEQELREWMRRVKTGEASRRQFMRTMLGLGLAGPVIADMLATYAPAAAQDRRDVQQTFTPTRRGGGGRLRLLSWQAPVILNPHFTATFNEAEASRIVYEPLTSVSPDGERIPILAAEIPSVANGGRAPDGTWTIWPLKQGVVWHDGAPFTTDDVVFTWEYATDPATGAHTRGVFELIRRIDKLNDHTIKVVFIEPTPLWYVVAGMILPKHRFAEYKGQNSRNAPYNLKPVGTGPYKIVDFKPGDVALYEINPHYHVPNRPFFDTVELKGGGDATSAARAVLQTGEFDFAQNMVVDKDVRERLAQQGRKGSFRIVPGTTLLHIQLNRTDPWTEVDGERSSIKVPHSFFTDLRVRQAFALAVDRRTIVEELYGVAAGQLTSNVLNFPTQFQSPHTRWEFNLDKAAQLLEQAGWKRGSDGVRVKDGRRMRVVYQAAVNLLAQKRQAIVKQALERLGIEVELKAINAGVYFSSDPGNPNTKGHFYADMQTYGLSSGFDPQASMRQFVSWEIAQKANNWAGQNVVRWSNAEYDQLWKQARTELDPVKRAVLFIRMNDLLIEDVVVIPMVWLHEVSAVSHSLRGLELSPWDLYLWNLAYWYRET